MAMNTANFGELLYPHLKSIYGDAYPEYKTEYTDIFDVQTTKRQYEESLSMSTLGAVPVKEQSAAIQYEDFKQNWTHRITQVAYALGFRVSRELYDFDQYGKINSFPKALKRSENHTIETVSANILNNAFTSGTGGDGSYLCVTNHALGKGGTGKNKPTTVADLTQTSLSTANIDISAFTDDAGKLIQARPKMLIVPPALEWDAKVLLKSAQEPSTANNALNPAQNFVGYAVNHRLTDPDAWFVTTDIPDGLVFYWSCKPEFARDNDSDNLDAKFRTYFRFAVGWNDWRAIYGSPGTP